MTVLAEGGPRKTAFGDNGFFVAFFIIGLINAEFLNITKSIDKEGFIGAILSTFDISLVQIVGVYVFIDLLSRAQPPQLARRDRMVLSVTAMCFIAPISNFSWAAMTFCSLYFIYVKSVDQLFRRALVILMGLCYTSFWSKLIFKYLLDYILRIDTLIVSTFTGTKSEGNLILAADGKTTLQVLEGCSSFANISLAVLGWLIARSYYGTSGALKGVFYIGLSTVGIIAVNTLRIGIIARDPALYDIAHGQIGATIASIASAAIIGLISIHGAKNHEAKGHEAMK